MLGKRRVLRAFDNMYNRARMHACVICWLVSTTPDPLLLSDEAVFTERRPPYDQERDS